MSVRRVLAATLAAAALVSPGTGLAGPPGDAGRGERVFGRQCAVCHSTTPGWHKEGPSLAGVIGRRADVAAGFVGYRALRGSDVVWTEDTLEAWLADPRGFSGRDSAMAVKLADPAARADVITYLRSLD